MIDNLTSHQSASEYNAVLKQFLHKSSNPKLGLKRVRDLLRALGFRRSSMKIAQIVGTNGKGSTAAFLQSLLLGNNLSVGLFSSPHLCSAKERIKIDGLMVDDEAFCRHGRRVLRAAERMKDSPSFFECLLGLSLIIFQDRGVDIAILEAGLGGRLDATTATSPDILGVSSIDLDHQNVLGDTVTLVALEKIAAARRGQSVVLSPQSPEARSAIDQAKREIGFDLIESKICQKPLGLFGEHQRINAGLALSIMACLGVESSDERIASALLKVCWPGRFELIDGACDIVLDGAHNPSGMSTLVKALSSHPRTSGRAIVLIYGSMRSKNADKKLEILLNSGLDIEDVFLHHPKNSRALAHEDLGNLFFGQKRRPKILEPFLGVDVAIERAASSGRLLLVCGSLYTVGEIRGQLLNIALDSELPNF